MEDELDMEALTPPDQVGDLVASFFDQQIDAATLWDGLEEAMDVDAATLM